MSSATGDDGRSDSDTERPTNEDPDLGPLQGPIVCVFKGVGDALAGGVMGSVFGFATGLFQKKGFKGALGAGAHSAKTFAILSGVHGFVTSALQQIRGKHDAINAGIAGCATGLALNTPGSPENILYGCLSFGAFSYVMERFSSVRPAIAMTMKGSKHHQRARLLEDFSFPVLPPFVIPPPLVGSFLPFHFSSLHTASSRLYLQNVVGNQDIISL